MITFDQARHGINKYIEQDFMPHLSGLKKLGVGIYAGLALENLESAYIQHKDHPAVSILGIVDAAGNIDIDKLYQSMARQFDNGQKYSVTFPVIGEVLFDKSDLEKLYAYMRE